VAIVFAVLGALLWAVQRTFHSATITALAAGGLSLWLGAQAALVASGKMTSLPLNGLPLFFGPILVVWIGLGLSPVGRQMASAVPLTALVAFQAFRLPLELVLHEWAAQGVIPGTMTWTGQNQDILSGVLALACAPLASRYLLLARLANGVGAMLLMNVIRVALFSSPVPFGWGLQPPLLLAFHLPYALIGPVCVGGALFGHIVLTRALWQRVKVERARWPGLSTFNIHLSTHHFAERSDAATSFAK
jgi:hypothetical protein